MFQVKMNVAIQVLCLAILSVNVEGLSKILVGLGLTDNGLSDTFEAIDLGSDKTTCEDIPKFHYPTYGVIGALVGEKNPTVCGGVGPGPNDYQKNCDVLKDGKWTKGEPMTEGKAYAAVASLSTDQLIVAGGTIGNGGPEIVSETAEQFTSKGWNSDFPDLPAKVYFHCMASINSTSVIAIGGVSLVPNAPAKSYIFNSESNSWKDGPNLKVGRYHHTCGQVKSDEGSSEFSVIVVGGIDGENSTKSVEILDLGENKWKDGPELPTGIYRAALVGDGKGGVVLTGGQEAQSKNLESLDTLYHLAHAGKGASWTKLPQKLVTPRSFHIAMLLPDDVVQCS